MDDKQIATLVLTLLKNVLKCDMTAMTENSYDPFDKLLTKHMMDMSKEHKDLMTVMLNEGWYELTPAEMMTVDNAYQKLEGIYRDLN